MKKPQESLVCDVIEAPFAEHTKKEHIGGKGQLYVVTNVIWKAEQRDGHNPHDYWPGAYEIFISPLKRNEEFNPSAPELSFFWATNAYCPSVVEVNKVGTMVKIFRWVKRPKSNSC